MLTPGNETFVFKKEPSLSPPSPPVVYTDNVIPFKRRGT